MKAEGRLGPVLAEAATGPGLMSGLTSRHSCPFAELLGLLLSLHLLIPLRGLTWSLAFQAAPCSQVQEP